MKNLIFDQAAKASVMKMLPSDTKKPAGIQGKLQTDSFSALFNRNPLFQLSINLIVKPR
jgi:hypothetical protein